MEPKITIRHLTRSWRELPIKALELVMDKVMAAIKPKLGDLEIKVMMEVDRAKGAKKLKASCRARVRRVMAPPQEAKA